MAKVELGRFAPQLYFCKLVLTTPQGGIATLVKSVTIATSQQ
ncbi:hypothetical protein [Pseudanabaena sp. FACHB-1998]|nr:hypothetical protein [Pseudanabaena sp. FACHB-1998]